MSKIIFKENIYKNSGCPGKIWINFALSIWISIILHFFIFISNWASFEEIFEAWGAFASSVANWPVPFIVIELPLWFLLIQRRPETKGLAIIAVLGYLYNDLRYFIFLSAGNLSMSKFSIFYEIIIFYVIISHVLFVIKGEKF